MGQNECNSEINLRVLVLIDIGSSSERLLRLVLPDQEKLQRVDEDEKGIVGNKRYLPDGDRSHQQAGTGHQNQNERGGRKVACFLRSDRLEQLLNANEYPCCSPNPAQYL